MTSSFVEAQEEYMNLINSYSERISDKIDQVYEQGGMRTLETVALAFARSNQNYFEDIKKSTGVEISDSVTQEGFRRFLKEENLNLLSQLRKVSPHKPAEDVVQEVQKKYKEYASNGWAGNLKRLYDALHVSPLENIVMEGVKKYIWDVERVAKFVENVHPFTKQKEILGEVYKTYIRGGNTYDLWKLSDLTKMRVKYAGDSVIDEAQKKFRDYIQKHEMGEFGKLQQCEVTPLREDVLEGYEMYAREEDYSSLGSLRILSRVELPEGLKNSLRVKGKEYIKEKEWGKLRKLRWKSGVELPENLLRLVPKEEMGELGWQ